MGSNPIRPTKCDIMTEVRMITEKQELAIENMIAKYDYARIFFNNKFVEMEKKLPELTCQEAWSLMQEWGEEVERYKEYRKNVPSKPKRYHTSHRENIAYDDEFRFCCECEDLYPPYD